MLGSITFLLSPLRVYVSFIELVLGEREENEAIDLIESEAYLNFQEIGTVLKNNICFEDNCSFDQKSNAVPITGK